MPRPSLTPADRASNVARAIASLPVALAYAQSNPSPKAWENVEALGAIVHRQARLLSGKSKGG